MSKKSLKPRRRTPLDWAEELESAMAWGLDREARRARRALRRAGWWSHCPDGVFVAAGPITGVGEYDPSQQLLPAELIGLLFGAPVEALQIAWQEGEFPPPSIRLGGALYWEAGRIADWVWNQAAEQ